MLGSGDTIEDADTCNTDDRNPRNFKSNMLATFSIVVSDVHRITGGS